jgi:hypothetical protein
MFSNKSKATVDIQVAINKRLRKIAFVGVGNNGILLGS